MLPDPATVRIAKQPLVPHVLTRKPVQPKKLPKPKPIQQAVKRPKIGGVSDDEEDDDEHEGQIDFFSLSKTDDLPTVPVNIPIPEPNPRPVQVTSRVEPINGNASKPLVQPINKPPVFTEPMVETNQETQYVPLPQAQNDPMEYNDYQYKPTNSSGIDKDALLRLAGKRNKGEAIDIIDFSADDLLLNKEEWMNKALTEEKPTYSYSNKKEGMPTQQQKRKHQITYLARQAQERELELKNVWANNRMTKKETQSKYGF